MRAMWRVYMNLNWGLEYRIYVLSCFGYGNVQQRVRVSSEGVIK